MNQAAIGFRVKSGWAMAVLLAGPTTAPQVVERRKIFLADPDIPESFQPYHAALGLAPAAAEKVAKRLGARVKRFAETSVTGFVNDGRGRGYRISRAALVVGSIVDPKSIKNDHIRAHAEEGRLFRTAVEDALNISRFKPVVIIEKDLFAKAAKLLAIPELKLKSELTALGKPIAGSWRAEDKAATLAAWIALTPQRS